MAALVERGQQPNEKDVQAILEFLGGFGDRVHQSREESILFPALLRDSGQKNYRELNGLIFEHNRQRSLIEGLQESVLTKDRKDFVYCAGRLVEILRQHIEEEEETLLPLADSTLSRDEDERVEADMKRQDKLWQDQNIPRLLRGLDELESKYMKTPAGPRGTAV
jgi:hemerythrin-like domain-containing protein